MKIAIMQPYTFPYLGYFQLINTVDCFVFFDDVNYIKRGWINKNNILVNDFANKFTVPVKGASQNKIIYQVELIDFINWKTKFIKTIEANYRKAPHYEIVQKIILDILNKNHQTIAELAKDSIRTISSFLDINTRFENSSDIEYTKQVPDGQQKILNICSLKMAKTYINPINGKELYDKESFVKNNLELNFIQMKNIRYNQFKKEKFVPLLSMIDVLMFNDRETLKKLLEEYDLINSTF